MSSSPPANSAAGSLHERYPWAVFVIPLILYMLLAQIEPRQLRSRVAETAPDEQPQVEASEGDSSHGGPASPSSSSADTATDQGQDTRRWIWFGHKVGDVVYPAMYTLRLAITIGVMLLLLEGYRQFPFRVSLLSVGVGIVGVVVWVLFCRLNLEAKLFGPIPVVGKFFLSMGERAAYNPLEALGDNLPLLIGFLIIRFTGLAVVVPVIEEFFLRGFLMRYVIDMYWERVPFGRADRTSIVIGTVYGMLAHPAELFAAAAWFSLVTWLMLRTRNIWDCVMAHAVTNFLLGVYVLTTGHWELW